MDLSIVEFFQSFRNDFLDVFFLTSGEECW